MRTHARTHSCTRGRYAHVAWVSALSLWGVVGDTEGRGRKEKRREDRWPRRVEVSLVARESLTEKVLFGA